LFKTRKYPLFWTFLTIIYPHYVNGIQKFATGAAKRQFIFATKGRKTRKRINCNSFPCVQWRVM